MTHLKWIIESFFEATEDVKLPDTMLKRLIEVADTSEDIGLSQIYSTRWKQAASFHGIVEELSQHVRSAILTPNGRCSGVLGIEKKTGRTVVCHTALNEWWPKIQCEIAKVGKLNFKRLRVLLAQENARAIGRFPRMKKSLEKYHQSLVRCLNDIDVLVLQSTFGSEPSFWHGADEFPPSEYSAGPLKGTKQQLAKWIMQKEDHRVLETPLKAGRYWGRQDARTQCSIWFNSQSRYAEANKRRLADNTLTGVLTDVEKR